MSRVEAYLEYLRYSLGAPSLKDVVGFLLCLIIVIVLIFVLPKGRNKYGKGDEKT